MLERLPSCPSLALWDCSLQSLGSPTPPLQLLLVWYISGCCAGSVLARGRSPTPLLLFLDTASTALKACSLWQQGGQVHRKQPASALPHLLPPLLGIALCARGAAGGSVIALLAFVCRLLWTCLRLLFHFWHCRGLLLLLLQRAAARLGTMDGSVVAAGCPVYNDCDMSTQVGVLALHEPKSWQTCVHVRGSGGSHQAPRL